MRSVPEDNVTLYSSPVVPSLTLVLPPEHVGIIGPSGEIFKKNDMKAINRQKQPPCIRCLDQKREKVEAFTKTFCSIHRGYGKKHCANKKGSSSPSSKLILIHQSSTRDTMTYVTCIVWPHWLATTADYNNNSIFHSSKNSWSYCFRSTRIPRGTNVLFLQAKTTTTLKDIKSCNTPVRKSITISVLLQSSYSLKPPTHVLVVVSLQN